MRKGWVLAAGVAAALSGGSTALADALTPDLRCAAVTFAAITVVPENQKTSVSLAAIYFLGKLDGAAPNLDLETRLRAELAGMAAKDFQSEAARCGAELAKRGQDMQTLGAHLQAPTKP